MLPVQVTQQAPVVGCNDGREEGVIKRKNEPQIGEPNDDAIRNRTWSSSEINKYIPYSILRTIPLNNDKLPCRNAAFAVRSRQPMAVAVVRGGRGQIHGRRRGEPLGTQTAPQ